MTLIIKLTHIVSYTVCVWVFGTRKHIDPFKYSTKNSFCCCVIIEIKRLLLLLFPDAFSFIFPHLFLLLCRNVVGNIYRKSTIDTGISNFYMYIYIYIKHTMLRTITITIWFQFVYFCCVTFLSLVNNGSCSIAFI